MPRSPAASVALWLLALTLAFAAAAAPATAAPALSGELLQNPGFEDPLDVHPWLPASWDTSLTDLPTAFFGRDTFLAHGGRYAVSVASTSDLVPVWHNWNQTLIVGQEAWGKDLVFSVWTRTPGLQGRAYILLQAYRDTIGKMAKTWGLQRDLAGKRMGITKLNDPLLDLGWKRVYFSEPETDWVRREARVFVPPSTNVVYVRCGLLGTGQVIFDDASLTLDAARPLPPAPLHTNLLPDPGFEGDGNEWEYSMPPYAGQRIVRDTTVAHSGKASVHYMNRDEGLVETRAGACQVLGRNLAGKRLRLSAWVKTDSLTLGTAWIRLYCNSLSRRMLQTEPGPTCGLTKDWTKLTVEMDVPLDAYEIWAWLAYSVPAHGEVYYDDASLEVVGPSSTVEPAAKSPVKKPASAPTPAGTTRPDR